MEDAHSTLAVQPPKRVRADDENTDVQAVQVAPFKGLPRCEFDFAPRCHHRHPLKRYPREAGASSDEPLVCDGGCGREIPPSDPRWSCFPCDYDICELCLVARGGGAAFIGLLAEEERKSASHARELDTMKNRCEAAEARLARKEREEKAAEAKAEAKASALAERRLVESKVAAAEEHARGLQTEVQRLEAEVVERRQRSKANLEKMYAAQKERDTARAEADNFRVVVEAQQASTRAAIEDMQEQLATAHRHIAIAQGDAEAVRTLISLEEAEQLEARARAALLAICERRASLAAAAESERQKRIDCAVCLFGARAVAFVPCGHIATCVECAPKVDDCPLCKAKITCRMPVYLP